MTTVHQSRRIAASADSIWEIVKDFGALDKWVPPVPGPLELTGEAATPGTERVFRNNGEISFVERFLGNDEDLREHSYSITRAPLPISNHRATIRVTDDGDHSVVDWTAEFDADDDQGEQIAESMVRYTYGPGLTELARLVEA